MQAEFKDGCGLSEGAWSRGAAPPTRNKCVVEIESQSLKMGAVYLYSNIVMTVGSWTCWRVCTWCPSSDKKSV